LTATFCGQGLLVSRFNRQGANAPDSFMLALGQLGHAGWELVAVQNGARPIMEPSGNTVVDTREFALVAHFKRPVVADRPVDQPVITLD
jgi:hypothetical protein